MGEVSRLTLATNVALLGLSALLFVLSGMAGGAAMALIFLSFQLAIISLASILILASIPYIQPRLTNLKEVFLGGISSPDYLPPDILPRERKPILKKDGGG